jgi:ribosomal-protein-alanine N-acetyltransferase
MPEKLQMRALQTERLVLRAFHQQDLDDVRGWELGTSEQAAQEFLDYCYREYTHRGIGPWAMQLKKTGVIIGNCGFPHIDPHHRIGEVNYYVARHHRGQGLATEALGALLEFGFGDLGFVRIQGRCPPDNMASERVLQKAEMKFERLVRSAQAASEPSAEERLYRILRMDFKRRLPA